MSKQVPPKKSEAKKPVSEKPEKGNGTLLARWFVIGDIHLKRTDPLGVVGKDGFNTRLTDRIEALRAIINAAVEQKATHIVLLGDIYDAVNPPEALQRLFWDAMEPVLHLPIRIIIGNHDSTKQVYNFSGNEVLLPAKTVLVHKEEYIETLYARDIDKELTIQYIPYKSTADEVLKELSANKKEPDLLFGHFEIAGAELASDNAIIRQGVDRDAVRGRLVWLGHIHKFQEFRPGFGYIGSLVQCDFGEVNNTKVFGIIDICTDGEIKYRYQEIPQRPMEVYDVKESDLDNLYLSENIPKELTTDGTLLKFRFVGSPEWIRSLDKVGFKKRFSKALRVVTEDIKLDSDRKKSEYATSLISDHVHHHTKEKKKGQEYLEAGLEIAAAVAEVEL